MGKTLRAPQTWESSNQIMIISIINVTNSHFDRRPVCLYISDLNLKKCYHQNVKNLDVSLRSAAHLADSLAAVVGCDRVPHRKVR